MAIDDILQILTEFTSALLCFFKYLAVSLLA